MDIKQRKARSKRWAVYRKTKAGKRSTGLAVVMVNTYEEAKASAELFFQDICPFGVIVVPAPKGFNGPSKTKETRIKTVS